MMSFEMNLPSCSSTSMCAGGLPSISFDFSIDDLYFVDK
jgi:hypothetical protein